MVGSRIARMMVAHKQFVEDGSNGRLDERILARLSWIVPVEGLDILQQVLQASVRKSRFNACGVLDEAGSLEHLSQNRDHLVDRIHGISSASHVFFPPCCHLELVGVAFVVATTRLRFSYYC